MKKIYNLFIVASLFVGLQSCSDFLDLQPQNELSEEQYFKTASQLAEALNGAYSTLQEGDLYGNWYVFAEVPSDNTRNALSGSVSDQDEFNQFYLRTTNPFLANFWTKSYGGINRVNTVLGRIDNVEMDNTLRERYKLECKFLRGLLYFNLVRVYGDVPLVLKEITKDEAFGYLRESKDKVYLQIIEDLKAAESLPATFAGANKGRATSGAAKSLLGTVYMTLNKYPEAEQKLKEVITSGNYKLLENTPGTLNVDGYAKVFDPNNHNSEEAIFEVQFKKGGFSEGSSYPNNFAPENSGTSVVSAGGTSGNNVPEQEMYDSYEIGDLRRDFSMALGYINNKNNAWVNARYVKKYADSPYQNNDSNNNYPVIRYADVLLMYAEALNQTANTSQACHYLNMVRRRGFGYQTSEVSPFDISTTSKDAFILLVEDERRAELAFEGHRWFDLIRTQRAMEVMKAKNYKLNVSNFICPIPQKQIDINPKLKQNDYKIEPK